MITTDHQISPNCRQACSQEAIAFAIANHQENACLRSVHDKVLVVSDHGVIRVLLTNEEWILDPMIWSFLCDDEGKPSEASPARILITGNTIPVREELKALGGRWDPAARGWWIPHNQAEVAKGIVRNAPSTSIRGRSRRRRGTSRTPRPAKVREFWNSSASIGEQIRNSEGTFRVIRIETRNVYGDAVTGWTPMEIRVARVIRKSSMNDVPGQHQGDRNA